MFMRSVTPIIQARCATCSYCRATAMHLDAQMNHMLVILVDERRRVDDGFAEKRASAREEQVEPVPGVGAVPHVARDAAVRVVAPRDAEERGAQDRGESEEAGELE